MNKLLVICGPTASGKTDLAIQLGQKVNLLGIHPIEIVSADSRQVYKGMDIGTGKNLPEGSIQNPDGSYHINGTRVWGYDLIEPDQDYSVSYYQNFARKKITEILKRSHLPVLVGGTGFYIKATVDGIDTISIPKNTALRDKLEEKSVEELFNTLFEIAPGKAKSLNNSDRNNPARLIRAIEVAKSSISSKDIPLSTDNLFIGLKNDENQINGIIEKSIKKRLEAGFEDEVQKLLDNGVRLNSQSLQSLGYKQFIEYMTGKTSKEKALNFWLHEELKYVKRQLTWFKKDTRINWFDSSDPSTPKKVEDLVKKWHNID